MFFSLSLQNILPRLSETDRLSPAPTGERRRDGNIRDHAALQRHQGTSAHSQKGRGAPGPA